MSRVDARVRWLLRTRAFVLLATAVVGVPSPIAAAELRLPREASKILPGIVAACPTCAATGFTPCGSPAVGWGARFARHALLGRPPRGYLVGFALAGADFRALARETPYSALVATLRERFAASRLVVLEDGFARARVLDRPDDVTVSFPEALHRCIADPTRPWGCCVGDCAHECCEKGLGSPMVALAWTDGDERITFHYSHEIGVSWLERRSPRHRLRYACLTDAKGTLRALP